jgi:hypothetical protein
MRALLLPLAFLAGCSDSRDVMDELPNSSIAGSPREDVPESRMEQAIARPVTIGEDGSRLAACGATGVVRGRTLELRSAPFREAKILGRLDDGTRLRVCTRSIDQRWLGVVVVPPAPPPSAETGNNSAVAADEPDCGVSDPVERRQVYDGPCRSGWVSSAAVQLVG